MPAAISTSSGEPSLLRRFPAGPLICLTSMNSTSRGCRVRIKADGGVSSP